MPINFKEWDRENTKHEIIVERRNKSPRTRRYVNDNEEFMERLFKIYNNLHKPTITFEEYYEIHAK